MESPTRDKETAVFLSKAAADEGGDGSSRQTNAWNEWVIMVQRPDVVDAKGAD